MSFLQTLGNLIWAVGVDQPRFQGNTPYYELEEIDGASWRWTADQMATLFRLSLIDCKLQLGEDLKSIFVDAYQVYIAEDGHLWTVVPSGKASRVVKLAPHLTERLFESVKQQKKEGKQSCRR